MSKFSKLEGQDVVVESALAEVSPVEEGWAFALKAMAARLGGYIVGTMASSEFIRRKLYLDEDERGYIARAFGNLSMIASDRLLKIAASKSLASVLMSEPMKKYIKEQCDAIYKETKKEVKNLSLKVKEALHLKADDKEMKKDERSIIKKYITDYISCQMTIEGYTIMATGDDKNVDSLYVVFYDPDYDKIIKKAIPAPNKEDLQSEEA